VAINWPDPKAPWVGRGYEERWQVAVAAVAWERRGSGGYVDWVKSLPCPRCGHIMSVIVSPSAYRGAGGGKDPLDSVIATCDCEADHQGRPEKRPRGCGYMAWIPLPETT
jgi:hypothetical protein